MKYEEKIILPHLGILVTTFCNLNCRRCADLIPKRESCNYEINDVINDLDKVLNSVDYIEEVLIIGGETLVYPNLKEIVEKCAGEPKIGRIIITTNGTIIPDDEVINILKDNDVVMRVSGYPNNVAPKREELINILNEKCFKVENLENMTWMDMGSMECRHRSEADLCTIFKTCSMKFCITLINGGYIAYCSRQITAIENDIYPDPYDNEFIRVRNCDAEELRKRFVDFYNLKYISTCNYCDGISCVTKRAVPTAVQILDKDKYFNIISLYEELINSRNADETVLKELEMIKLLTEYNEKLIDVDGFADVLNELSNIYNAYKNEQLTNERLECSKYMLFDFISEITSDYNFEVRPDNKFINKYTDKAIERNVSNKITVGFVNEENESNCDILVTDDDVIEAARRYFNLDIFAYNRLYVQAKLNRLKHEKCDCLISGLSYTQYGIIEKFISDSTVNISVTGQDIPYSVLMAHKALQYNNDIKVVVIPFAYYHESYDMSVDTAAIHQSVVSRINVPVLGENDRYTGPKMPLYYKGLVNPIYNQAFRLDKINKQFEIELMKELEKADFFDFMPRSTTGGLKFNYMDLNKEEKYKSAGITAQLNERICTEDGRNVVREYLTEFLDDMKYRNKKVVFFAPPMTEYLYKAYSDDIKKRYYDYIDKLLSEYDNLSFIDYSSNDLFKDEDFCDFEHLSNKGAEKLSKSLSVYVNELIE